MQWLKVSDRSEVVTAVVTVSVASCTARESVADLAVIDAGRMDTLNCAQATASASDQLIVTEESVKVTIT